MSKTIAQAGAIAFKIVSGAPLVMLVRAKQNPEHWIFPKGHVDEGETPAVAAARELEEEAAIKGEMVAFVGFLEFHSGDERVRVDYFLFRFVDEVEPTEERESRWCAYEEALALLSHRDAAELLQKARPLMENDKPN